MMGDTLNDTCTSMPIANLLSQFMLDSSRISSILVSRSFCFSIIYNNLLTLNPKISKMKSRPEMY